MHRQIQGNTASVIETGFPTHSNSNNTSQLWWTEPEATILLSMQEMRDLDVDLEN